MTETPPPNGKAVGWFNAVKNLTFTQLLIIALATLILIPVYFVYRVLNEPEMLDKFLSSYSEVVHDPSGCTVRKVRLTGGPWRWGIAAGFAFSGSDRWQVSVILNGEPSEEEIMSYCAALNLIADRMAEDNGQ